MWIVNVWDSKGQLVNRVPFKSGIITLGRDPDCTVVLNLAQTGKVSPLGGKHAQIEAVDASRVLYTDEGAPGGSKLDGARIEGCVFLGHGKQVEIPGFRIGLEQVEKPVAKPAVTRPVPVMDPSATADDPMTREFERQLKSIQSHRETVQQSGSARKAQLDQGWAEILVSARNLQARLLADTRVQHFTISRDGREITVKVTAPMEKLGYRFFVLSRLHPEGRFPELDAIWLREFGRDDANFPNAQKALTELVQRIAGTLA